MRSKCEKGFSLMEMMVVLLIMSIIMAASAPIVSRKMTKSSGSPWVITDNRGNIAYNMGGRRVTAIIGAATLPASAGNPRLFIDCGDNADAQITFGHGDEVARVIADPINWRVGISSAAIPNHSVAFGGDQGVGGERIVAIGQSASATQDGATAVGADSSATNNHAIAIGGAQATGVRSIAIGNSSQAQAGNVSNVVTAATARNSVAVGASALVNAVNSVAFGNDTTVNGQNSTAIGDSSRIEESAINSVAIGASACVERTAMNSIAIGNNANVVSGKNASIAIGNHATANGVNSIAIGNGTIATGSNAIAIGNGIATAHDNVIVLGNRDAVVYIPGHLVVGRNTYLGSDGNSVTWLRHKTYGKNNWHVKTIEVNSGKNNDLCWGANWTDVDSITRIPHFMTSDRRLKNVEKEYTAGLEELKKLKLYNYTYKFDDTKTPQVGVIAQDLEEVFPNAVKLGNDGYLLIRKEDMFYALINAVKELDTKIASIIQDITGMKSRITELENTVQAQNERISALEKMIEAKK